MGSKTLKETVKRVLKTSKSIEAKKQEVKKWER